MNVCELSEFIENELVHTVNSLDTIDYIEKILVSNVKAFTFANKPLTSLTMYVVVRHIGEVTIFKTINDKIIKSKLDTSYVKSRELLGLEQWNINKVYKICFGDRGAISYTSISLKQLSSVLSVVIEPHNLCYTIKLKNEDSGYHVIRVDKDLVGSVSYPELLKIVTKAYTSSTDLKGVDDGIDIYLVGYVKN